MSSPTPTQTTLQDLWNSLDHDARMSFLEDNGIRTAPPAPLSYEAELRSEQSDLDEDRELLNEEMKEIDDLKGINDDEFALLEERKLMSNRNSALIEEKRKANDKARALNKNALDLEAQRKFRELKKGRMKNTTDDDLQDLIQRAVRREVAKLALNAKSAQMREGDASSNAAPASPPSAAVPPANAADPSQPTYAELMKKKKRNLKQPSDLIDFNTNSETDDEVRREDEFPPLLTGTKKKTNVRFDTTTKGSPDDVETQSLVSVGSSLFESNPVSVLLYKLKKRHKSALKTMRDFPDQIKVLEMERDQITRVLHTYEREVRELQSVGPAEREELSNYSELLEEDQLQIVLLLSKIHQSIEDKKNNPRPTFPKFNGTYTDYNNFQKEIDAAMTHLDDPQKKTVYKNAVTQGINKDEISMLLSNCDTYLEMKEQMFSKFGHFDSVLPAQLDIISDLPSSPATMAVESQNVGVMLSFMRWLQSNEKTSVFTTATMVTCRKKLRSFTQDLYRPGQCKNFHEFKQYLKDIQNANFERLNGQGGSGGGGSGGTGGGGGGKGKPVPTTRTHANASHHNNKVKSCYICGGDHYASKTQSLFRQNISH